MGVRDIGPQNVYIMRKNDKFELRILPRGYDAYQLQEIGLLNEPNLLRFKNPLIQTAAYSREPYEPFYDFYALGEFIDYIVEVYLKKFYNSMEEAREAYQKMYFYSRN